jgi:CheY-like chemotaxis protein
VAERSGRLPRVLLVDDDADLIEVVSAVLGDEGYEVCLPDGTEPDEVQRAVNRHEPDCILLDSAQRVEYGASWESAARIQRRHRQVPTVMFTGHELDSEEARDGRTQRAAAAGFSAVLSKPFGLDDLLKVVHQSVAKSQPFDESRAAERGRTAALVSALDAAGAVDIRPSSRREWANFRSPSGDEMQLYWWQSRGQYLVGRYTADGLRLLPVGRYFSVDDAVAAALEGEASPVGGSVS